MKAHAVVACKGSLKSVNLFLHPQHCVFLLVASCVQCGVTAHKPGDRTTCRYARTAPTPMHAAGSTRVAGSTGGPAPVQHPVWAGSDGRPAKQDLAAGVPGAGKVQRCAVCDVAMRVCCCCTSGNLAPHGVLLGTGYLLCSCYHLMCSCRAGLLLL
jgi:hypothetical protein